MAEANGAPTNQYAAFIERRRARYTAQALEIFEDRLEKALKRAGQIDPEIRAGIDEAKAAFRRKIQELATDAIETVPLTGQTFRQNALAQELADPLRLNSGADPQGVATS